MNKFKFRGVGQGLFYTGSLMHGTYNFVFDCGSTGKSFYRNEKIKEYIRELGGNNGVKPHIDFVVVSHFHEDHFNGIYNLLTQCNVDTLYLPYLMGDANFKKFALAYISFYNFFAGHTDHRDGEDGNFENCLTLYRTLKSLYRIDDARPNFDTRVIIADENDCGEPITFSVGNNRDKYWEFKIFHRNLNPHIICDLNADINALMQRKGYANLDDENIINFIRKSKKEIRLLARKYENVFGKKNKYKLQGGLNISSLVLAHYPLYRNSIAYYPNKIVLDVERLYRRHYYYCCCMDELGQYDENNKITLLTGDAHLDSRFTQFLNFVSDRRNKNNILILQVPHHGAKENWGYVKALNLHAAGYVIPFGLGNRYGHPHSQTVYDLKDEKYYCVTQEQSFEYIFD